MPRILPIPYKKLVRVLELDGFVLVRERGDHMIFRKSGILRPIVLSRYDALPVFIIRNVLRTAGIDRDRYFNLLERI